MSPASPTVHLAQPTLIARPFHREGWVYEEKVDGYRMVAYKSAPKVKLFSRNGRDHTQRFAGIAEAIRLIPEATLVLDGEVAIYDQRLVSRFEWMRHHAPPELATPPLFMAFDCVRVEWKDLRPNPLYVRRNILEELLYKQDQVNRPGFPGGPIS